MGETEISLALAVVVQLPLAFILQINSLGRERNLVEGTPPIATKLT